MPTPSRDISAAMEDIYIYKLRELSGAQRMEIAAGLSNAVREMAIAGIKSNRPGISEEELRAELFRRIY